MFPLWASMALRARGARQKDTRTSRGPGKGDVKGNRALGWLALLLTFALHAGLPPATLAGQGVAPAAPDTARTLSRAEQELFLERAKIVRTREMGKGVTRTLRATLTDGTTTHDASIQVVDERHDVFQSKRGTEIGFRDTWRYNLAAYHLSLMLDLDMVPTTVERKHAGKDASFTWWVDDVLMDEGERLKKKVQAPDREAWNRQLWTLRIFDQLIENTDRNLGNMLIDARWKVWMIDHTRAFRRSEKLRNDKNLERCDKAFLKALKALDAATLEKRLGRWLGKDELEPILDRRDLITAFFDAAASRVY
ncbi:MAG: hypothetical protein ABR606_18135 [Vicinamibacterales bacterium]